MALRRSFLVASLASAGLSIFVLWLASMPTDWPHGWRWQVTKLGAPGFLAAFVAGQHHAGKFAFSATIFTVNWLLYLILFWPVFGLLFSLRDSDSGPSTKS